MPWVSPLAQRNKTSRVAFCSDPPALKPQFPRITPLCARYSPAITNRPYKRRSGRKESWFILGVYALAVNVASARTLLSPNRAIRYSMLAAISMAPISVVLMLRNKPNESVCWGVGGFKYYLPDTERHVRRTLGAAREPPLPCNTFETHTSLHA